MALIVIFVSYKLGKRSVDVLLDKKPENIFSEIQKVLKNVSDITNFHDVKIRTAGADTFVEVNIHVKPDLTIKQAHEISHTVENEIRKVLCRCEVHVHTEPEE